MTISTMTLEGPIADLRVSEIEAMHDLATLLAELGDHTEEDRVRLRDMARDLSEMFFIVAVIGEFNAGKSSFVNALIGEKLLPIGITPTTEYIELIRYSEIANRTPHVREDGLREWAHPNTGAPAVAIVDTPGTGSVFQKHEKTAKDFLHRSDLVIFVISSKRAFADTERMYLQMAQDFGKKVILVINQVDLLNPSEQMEVRRFIESQVKDRLNLEPLIFLASAKEALANPGSGGIDAVKAHLRGVYSQVPPARQKLVAQLETSERIVQKYLAELKKRADLVNFDVTKVRDVQKELDQQSQGLERRLQEAGGNIATVLQGVRTRGLNFIDTHLSLRRIGRGVDHSQLQVDFQEVVIGRSLRDIQESTGDYINAVIDQSRLYWRGVIDRLNQLRDLLDQEVSGLDSGIYAEQRASLQDAIRIAENELKSYSGGQVLADMETLFRANVASFQGSALLTASGLVVALLAFLTPGPLVGTVGGIAAAPLALPAFIVGGVVAGVFGIPALRALRRIRNDIKSNFNERVDLLIRNYDQALTALTSRERLRLTQYGNQILTPIFSRLEVLAKRNAENQAAMQELQQRIRELRQSLEHL